MRQLSDHPIPLHTRRARKAPLTQRPFCWLLVFVFIFLTTHGRFWFLEGGGQRALLGYLLPVAVYAVIVCALFSRLAAVLVLAWTMRVIVLLALFTLASALWSQDPLRSVVNGCLYLVDSLFALYLVIAFSTEELMELFMMAGAVIGVVSVFLALLLPSVGLAGYAHAPGAWRGLFQDRNSCGLFAVFFLSPALSLGRAGLSFKRVLYILLMLLLLIKVKAVTALIVSLTYVGFLLALRVLNRLGPRTAATLSGTILPPLLLVVVLVYSHLSSLLVLFGRDPTLTGRTQIWDSLFRSISKHPFLGYGFYSFWLGLSGESANAIIHSNWMFGYAHNGLLEVVLQIGLVGTSIFFVIFAQSVWDAWTCFRADRTRGTEWMLGLLALTVLYNISEETIVWPNDIFAILFLIACTRLALTAQELRKAPLRKRRRLHDLSLAG